MPPLKLVDVTDDDFEVYQKMVDDVGSKDIDKPRVSKIPGVTVGVAVLTYDFTDIVTTFGTSRKRKFTVKIVRFFQDNDFMDGVGKYVDKERAKCNRLSQHFMTPEEIKKFKDAKAITGNAKYSPPVVDGAEFLYFHQILEVNSFQPWKTNGRDAAPGDYLLLKNLHFEEKLGGNTDIASWNCENVMTFRPKSFERVEELIKIGPYLTTFIPLWQTDEDRETMTYPERIDILMSKLPAAGAQWARARLEEEMRKFQCRPDQLQFFCTGICVPFKKDTVIGAKFGRIFADIRPTLTPKPKEGKELEEQYTIVNATTSVLQITNEDGKNKHARVGIHITFSREAVNQFGITNEVVKPLLLGDVINNAEGVMWCSVDIMNSTNAALDTPVDQNEESTLDWQVFLRCESVTFDREKMVKKTCLPITFEYAKQLLRHEVLNNHRNMFSLSTTTKIGDRVYNASESTSSPEDDYHYYMTFQGINDMTITRVNELVEKNNWNLEQLQVEITNGLLGKNKNFSTCFKPFAFSDKTFSPVIWGIKKEPRVETPSVNALALYKAYNEWYEIGGKTVDAIKDHGDIVQPQIQAPAPNPDPAPIAEEKKRKASGGSSAKRQKKELKMDD